MLLEIVGFIGMLLVSGSCFPQLYKTYLTKDVNGLSGLMLICLIFGCIMMFGYVYITRFSLPLLINYTIVCSVSLVNLILFIQYRK